MTNSTTVPTTALPTTALPTTAPPTSARSRPLGAGDLDTLAAGDGRHLHFLNHLATIKVAAQDSASGLNAVEFTAPQGSGRRFTCTERKTS